jgi:hypothetical protein
MKGWDLSHPFIIIGWTSLRQRNCLDGTLFSTGPTFRASLGVNFRRVLHSYGIYRADLGTGATCGAGFFINFRRHSLYLPCSKNYRCV